MYFALTDLLKMLKCIKLYLTKIVKKETKKCINIHLNIDLIIFNKYYTCKLLYMNVSQAQYINQHKIKETITKNVTYYLLKDKKN